MQADLKAFSLLRSHDDDRGSRKFPDGLYHSQKIRAEIAMSS